MTSSSPDPELVVTAHHEAGHVVACWALHRTHLESASIIGDADRLGVTQSVRMAPPGFLAYAHEGSLRTGFGVHSAKPLVERVRLSLAGYAAERVHTDDSQAGCDFYESEDPDFLEAAECILLSRHPSERPEGEEFERWDHVGYAVECEIVHLVRLLRESGAHVKAIAEELIRVETMDRDALHGVLSALPDIPVAPWLEVLPWQRRDYLRWRKAAARAGDPLPRKRRWPRVRAYRGA